MGMEQVAPALTMDGDNKGFLFDCANVAIADVEATTSVVDSFTSCWLGCQKTPS